MNWQFANDANAHLWTVCAEFAFIRILASTLRLSVLPAPSGVMKSVFY